MNIRFFRELAARFKTVRRNTVSQFHIVYENLRPSYFIFNWNSKLLSCYCFPMNICVYVPSGLYVIFNIVIGHSFTWIITNKLKNIKWFRGDLTRSSSPSVVVCSFLCLASIGPFYKTLFHRRLECINYLPAMCRETNKYYN